MRSGRRDERGSVTPLVVGFAAVLAFAVALVVDASAAYLQRQGLATLADGAALAGADGGATGSSIYTEGVPEARLDVEAGVARAAVVDYLAAVGAERRYPGLTVGIEVVGDEVRVRLSAPLDLPLRIPGGPEEATVAAEGSAVVTPG